MKGLRVLNRKQAKQIISLLEKQWDFSGELDFIFLINAKNRVHLASRSIADVDWDLLRINSAGLYIGELTEDQRGIRLSIEGSQIIGPYCSKNIVDLDTSFVAKWLRGEDLELETDAKGFVIVKGSGDFLGCGRAKDGKILNFVPKIRRMNVIVG